LLCSRHFCSFSLGLPLASRRARAPRASLICLRFWRRASIRWGSSLR